MIKRQSGFTLIELVMVIMLIGIISVVVGRTLFESYKTFITSQNISDTDWQGFLALERIADDIHTIRSAADMTTVQSTLLTFNDVNGNSVQYQLSGTSLLRNAQTLATGIQSLSFTYTDKNGALTATPSAVRYITISLTLLQGNLSATFSTMAATRGMS